PPTGGEILWKGESIYDVLLPYRSIVGYCPQHPNIERELSLGENLVFSRRCYGLSKSEAIERCDEKGMQLFLSWVQLPVLDL
ncbi:MAG: hypothetical protein P0S93_04980, partial [Candidatus Neptunochlamydia sp.]|nr:hypothetical protein [Candidatus Neptunochlamydia sp.]